MFNNSKTYIPGISVGPCPTGRTRLSLFVWLLPLDLSNMGGPTSSYATVGTALRVSGALKPHHHGKVVIASVGNVSATKDYIFQNSSLSTL
jgi:hypothetical protein